MSNGKGSKPRPLAVARKAFLRNWEETFGPRGLAPTYQCGVCGASMMRVECCEACSTSKFYHCPKCQPELLPC